MRSGNTTVATLRGPTAAKRNSFLAQRKAFALKKPGSLPNTSSCGREAEPGQGMFSPPFGEAFDGFLASGTASCPLTSELSGNPLRTTAPVHPHFFPHVWSAEQKRDNKPYCNHGPEMRPQRLWQGVYGSRGAVRLPSWSSGIP